MKREQDTYRKKKKEKGKKKNREEKIYSDFTDIRRGLLRSEY